MKCTLMPLYKACLWLLGCSLSISAQAQFNVINNAFSIPGNACSANCFQLTTTASNQRGAIWNTTQLNLNNYFDLQFCINLGADDGGADGMVFVLQNVGINAQGNSGGAIGYDGMGGQSVGIEFDDFDNSPTFGDIPQDHIAVNFNGVNAAPPFAAVPALSSGANIEDGNFHDVRIIWDPSCTRLRVFFDGELRVDFTNNLVANVFAGNANVTWGWVASTGGATNNQQVCVRSTSFSAPSTSLATSLSLCAGSSGSLDAGTGFSQYLWSSGETTQSITVNTSNTYLATLTHPSGCTVTASSTVTVGSAVSASFPSQTNVSCFGGNDGTVTASGSGGFGSYTYRWAQGNQTTAQITNLSAGNYPITITDANGCTTTATASITQPSAALSLSLVNRAQVVCGNGCTGQATASPSGGTSPYTYSWSNGTSTALNNNLCVGNYTLTVSDANNCTTSQSFNVISVSISAGADVAVCPGNSTSLSAVSSSDVLSLTWTPSSSLSSSNSASVTATPASNTTYTVTGSIVGVNLVANSDFASGNTGFSSDYVFTPGPNTSQGQYIVTNTPSSFNGGFLNCPDHTPTADGQMLVVNGATIAGQNVWCQNVPVRPGANYAFSTWVQSLNASNPAILQFSINGVVLGTPFNASATPCQWDRFFALWNAGASSTAQVCIVNQNTIASGNDFALDDLFMGEIIECSDDVVVSIQPTSTLTTTTQPAACFGQSSGSIDLSVAGTPAPYQYAWSTGATTQDLNGIGQGSYGVTVLDGNGCSATATASVSQPSVLSATTSVTAVRCFNTATGTATVSPSGGTNPYTFVWSNAQTTATATGLTAGNHSVTVSDANGCTLSLNVSINNANPISGNTSTTDVSCFGGSNGTATYNVNGGVGGFTFAWANGQTGATATGLSAGTYCVTASDANGCTISNCATVIQPAALTAPVFVATAISCNGGTNGALTASTSGGIQPYTYLWSNGRTTATATGLGAGAYTLTITDANGCRISGGATLTQPSAISISLSSTNANCFGTSTGSATATASGGTGPYSYLWSNTRNGSTNANIPAGTYFVTVTDFNNCRAVASTSITQPAAVTANISNLQMASCNGRADGSATAVGGGGTPGYTFQWSDGQASPVATGMAAGSYRVTVTDTRGCSATAATTITQPTAITANAQVFSNYNGANVTCPGAADGSARVLASGGNGNFIYNWSSIPSQVSNTATGLTAGTYTVTVTDAAGCSVSRNVTLNNPVALAATISQQNIFCNGQQTGQIIANATPGTGTLGINGYEYSISGPNQIGGVFSAQNSFFNLAAGTYTVIVRDGNGCQLPLSVTLTEPTALNLSLSSTAIDCHNSNNGTATASLSGGTSPYRYRWSNGQTNQTAVGLAAGGYVVTVTDANGCDRVGNVTITQPSALAATVTSTGVGCNGASNGSASAQVSGGTAPYAFQWSNGQTNQNATNFTVGNHSLTITDANNCRLVRNFSIGQPSVLTVNTSRSNATCNGSATGTATANATGGTSPYSYQWDNGQTTQTATGLVAGAYAVLVIDANGCSANALVTIGQPNALQAVITSQTNVSCNGGSNGRATVSASGGTAPFRYLWSNGQTTAAASGLSAGTQQVTVTDAANCQVITSLNLLEPTALLVDTLFIQDVRCRNGNDGQITARASGGTAPYTFVWSNGRSTATITGLTANTYRVTATDANGCTASRQGIVNQPVASLVANTNSTAALCNGSSTGQMVVIASGGTPLANGDYNYLWSNGATTSLVTSMSAGNYTVTVTDANGCSLSRTASIGQGGSINLSITNRVTVTCFGGNNGAATAVASGGTGALSFQWNDLAGQTTATATGLSAGTYTVVVSDQNGCTRQDSVVIPQDAQVRVGSIVTNVSCFGGSDGSIRLNSPTRPISLYEWSTGAIGANLNQINNLSAGDYQVTVTTSLGCTASFEYSLSQPDTFTLAVNLVQGLACASDTNAIVEVTAQGGTPNYSYVWSNGSSSTNVRLSNLDAGAYSVIATDRNGCTATGSINITAPSPLALSTTVTDASCANVANGSIEVAATGGTLPSGLYTFSLDSLNWQTGNLFPALLGNVYQVYVRDDNGCVNSVQTTVQDGDPFFIVAATADTTIQYGDTLGLEVELNDTSNVRLQWSIVGSGNPILDSLNYLLPVAPMEETIYRFTAINGPGCSLDTQIVVKIEKRRYANAPTGFTPNGDGVNDRFFVQGETDRIRSVKNFRVYDRWGELVYEVQNANLSDPQLGWDGSFDGKKLNSGVFAWYAEIEFVDGKVEVFKGDVTLLR